jgi:hypothetical protein
MPIGHNIRIEHPNIEGIKNPSAVIPNMIPPTIKQPATPSFIG